MLFRRSGLLTKLLPSRIQQLEPQMSDDPSGQILASTDCSESRRPRDGHDPLSRRAADGLRAGSWCSQTSIEIRSDVLLANGCEVHTPAVQFCCGSLHGHNGESESSRALARRNLDLFDIQALDAIITNAAGCGSHLKTYDRLLAEEEQYAERAAIWSRKCKDISEFLVQIGFRPPTAAPANLPIDKVTYHEACHLCHGQRDYRSTSPDTEINSRTKAHGTGRIDMVLWQRWYLQHHPAGHVTAVAFQEAGSHRKDRRHDRRHRKSWLPSAN